MTGLVYVAIVALWAAVLIPMWLRRHDDDQARRIERHRVAMGTLARMSDAERGVHAAAARRRRVIVAAAGTLGALGTGAWVAGMSPGLVAIVLWLPLVVYVPVAIVAERRLVRRAADAALEERRARRSRPAVEPTPITTVVPPARSTAPMPSRSDVEWDDVFDQTA